MFEKHVNIWNELWKNYRRKLNTEYSAQNFQIHNPWFGMERGCCSYFKFTLRYLEKNIFWNFTFSKNWKFKWSCLRIFQIYSCYYCLGSEKGHLQLLKLNWFWNEYYYHKFVWMKLRLAIAFYLRSVTGLKFCAFCAGYCALLL